MTDIIQRLRLVDPNQVLLAPPPNDTSYLNVGIICHEAATEIERLRAEIKRLNAQGLEDVFAEMGETLVKWREINGKREP